MENNNEKIRNIVNVVFISVMFFFISPKQRRRVQREDEREVEGRVSIRDVGQFLYQKLNHKENADGNSHKILV